MDAIIQFMQSVTGRTLRAALGLILIALGIFMMQQGALLGWGIVIALIGLIPLVGGLLGVTLIAPFFGYTLTGHKRVGSVGS